MSIRSRAPLPADASWRLRQAARLAEAQVELHAIRRSFDTTLLCWEMRNRGQEVRQELHEDLSGLPVVSHRTDHNTLDVRSREVTP